MKIRNKKTGEVREISPEEASKYGVKSDPKGNSVMDLINMLTFGLPKGAMKVATDPNLFQLDKPTINPLELAGQFLKKTAPATAPAAATAATYYGIPTMAKALLPYATIGGREKLTELFTNRANQSGNVVGNQPLLDEVKNQVIKKNIDPKMIDSRVQDALSLVEDYITSKSPGYQTPTDLVSLRRYASQQLPSNFWSSVGNTLQGKGTEAKVWNVARDVFSKTAKDITPGLSNVDRISSISNNIFGQDLPGLLTRLGGGALLGTIFGKSAGKQISNQILP